MRVSMLVLRGEDLDLVIIADEDELPEILLVEVMLLLLLLIFILFLL